MKWKVIAAAFIAGVAGTPVVACVDPMSIYSAGVVFSKGEVIATENIGLYSQDSLSYIKTCDVVSGEQGQPFKLGSAEGQPADFLSIDSAWTLFNTLYVNVQYGGGCKVHAFELYTSGEQYMTLPGQYDLYLTHDAHGDNCKALVHETLVFNLYGLDSGGEVQLNVYAPGAHETYSPSPLWTPVSGLKTNFCSYKMKSAYSEKVMAYIGPYGNIFRDDSSLSLKQLLVIFDSTQGVPSNAVKAAAVLAEIERLTEMNVLSMTATQLQSIETQLSAMQGQYWTKEDTVLDFNMWFDGSAVNGVRAVYSVKSCGAGISYELPEKSIASTAIVTGHNAAPRVNRTINALSMNNGIFVEFTPVSGKNTMLTMTDMHGRLVASISLAVNAQQAIIQRNRTVPGCYIVSIIDNGKLLQSGVISVTGR
jgi:hypothetical protein